MPPDADPRRLERGSLSILGPGFVEAIHSDTLDDLRRQQPSSMRGLSIDVDVLEAPGRTRSGGFGWKNQQASLVSFSADAYVNEASPARCSPTSRRRTACRSHPSTRPLNLTDAILRHGQSGGGDA